MEPLVLGAWNPAGSLICIRQTRVVPQITIIIMTATQVSRITERHKVPPLVPTILERKLGKMEEFEEAGFPRHRLGHGTTWEVGVFAWLWLETHRWDGFKVHFWWNSDRSFLGSYEDETKWSHLLFVYLGVYLFRYTTLTCKPCEAGMFQVFHDLLRETTCCSRGNRCNDGKDNHDLSKLVKPAEQDYEAAEET